MKNTPSSFYWRIILCIVRFKALRPRQRLVYFENIHTVQKIYAITFSTHQRLIEKIFERHILPLNNRLLRNIQISNLPIGSNPRYILTGNIIPHAWHSVYIRALMPKD